MNQPTPRRQPDGRPAASSVDWPAALAEHGRWLRTVVGARLGEPQAVDEVLQEVALAAVAQKAPLADPSRVAPWLYRLAVRQTLLYRRKQGRRRKLTDRYAARKQAAAADSQPPDPLGWLLAEERRQQVRQALAGSAETRRRNPVVEIHRRLELPRDGPTLGHQRECRRGAPASRPAKDAGRIDGARRN